MARPTLPRISRASIGLTQSQNGYICPQCSFARRGVRRYSSSTSASSRTRTQQSELQSYRPSDILRQPKNPALLLRKRFPESSTYAAQPSRQYATTVSSPIAINQTRPIATRALYDALTDLEKRAANYVSLGRVKLALRGLEEGAPVRVAVLGMGNSGMSSARKLVRLLLLDPLGGKGEWEKKLFDEEDGRAVLLRYGEDGESSTSNTLLRTLFVPSRLLQTHNLEILISSLDVDVSNGNGSEASNTEQVLDSLLVPRLEAQTSTPGGYSTVAYPVHKTLLLGDGLQDLVSYGRFTAGLGSKALPSDMVKLAVNAASPPQEQENSSSNPSSSSIDPIPVVDIQLADSGVAKFRESINNSVFFEHAWFRSGIEPLSAWLTGTSITSKTSLQTPVKALISSILSAASSRIAVAETTQLANSRNSSVSPAVRANILTLLDRWAENAHTELRNNLDLAFASKHWAKLKWWKLLWRADDVSMISSEVLERRWLVQAEKEIIFISGRLVEAGLLDPATRRIVADGPVVVKEVQQEEDEDGVPQMRSALLSDLMQPDLYRNDEGEIYFAPGFDADYPQNIPLARLRLSRMEIPPLQALAQKLVVQSASTAALSTAVSVLAYVSVSSTSLFEASSVAAFGLVLALRRLQGGWEGKREEWQKDVREQGRRALKETEERVRFIVNEGGKGEVDEVLVGDLEVAKGAVEEVRDALSRMGE